MPTIDELERAIVELAETIDIEHERNFFRGSARVKEWVSVEAIELALTVLTAALDRERNEPSTCEGVRSEELQRAIDMLENQDATLSVSDIAAVQYTTKMLRKIGQCAGCIFEEFLTLHTPLETCLACARYQTRSDRYELKGEQP